MPREQLQLLAGDVDRLLAAGAAVAAGDEKLRQRGGRLRELGQKVPVLAQIADAVDRTVNAPPKQVTPALLDLLLVVRQVRASLTAAGADGAAEPVPPSGPWASAAATRELEGWIDNLTASGGNRPKKLKKALEHPGFTDLRLVEPLLRALGVNHHGLARLVAEKALPAFGPAVLPDLERGLDLKGKSGDARRLQAICALDKGKGAALCRQALADGSTPVKIQGLRSLSLLAPRETEKAALALLEQKAGKPVHAAAYYALATGKSDEALEALIQGVVSERGEDWELRDSIAHGLRKLTHPRTTARLLEELAKAQEEVRTRQAAKGKKKAPVGKGAAKGSKAQAKQAQKDAQLLEQAVERTTRLANLLGERGDRKAVSSLRELLGHPNADVRESAAEALIDLDDPDGLRAVADLLEDKQVWSDAVRAAWNLPGQERFDRLAPLCASLSDVKKSQRTRAESVLELFEEEAEAAFRPEEGSAEEATDEDFDEEDEFAYETEGDPENEATKLHTDWDSRWVPLLLKHLGGPNRAGVAIALEVVQGAKAVPALLKELAASVKKNECAVVEALGRLGARTAVAPMIDLLPGQPAYHYCIHDALRHIGDPAAIPLLEKVMAKLKHAYRKDRIEEVIEYLQRQAAK